MGKVKLRKVTKKGRMFKCPVSGQGKERVWFLTPALLLTPGFPFLQDHSSHMASGLAQEVCYPAILSLSDKTRMKTLPFPFSILASPLLRVRS